MIKDRSSCFAPLRCLRQLRYAKRRVFTRIPKGTQKYSKMFISFGLLRRVVAGFWRVPEHERLEQEGDTKVFGLSFVGKPEMISEGGTVRNLTIPITKEQYLVS